jgi:hypothetical protein
MRADYRFYLLPGQWRTCPEWWRIPKLKANKNRNLAAPQVRFKLAMDLVIEDCLM